MGLDVIGAGFGRTGTLSLKRALEDLGFGPTYHMEEVFKHPSHIARWHRFATGGGVAWDELFDGFSSGVDFPVSCVWRELADRYAEAKVVLTVRDPERWWQSTFDTIYGARDMFPAWLRRVVPITGTYLDMNERMVWDGLFDGRFAEREHAIDVFERHIDEVRATIPADRLLVYEVAQGWGPLCAFLDVPEPTHAFPSLNDAASMRTRIAAVRIATRATPLVAAVLAGALLRRSRPRSR